MLVYQLSVPSTYADTYLKNLLKQRKDQNCRQYVGALENFAGL